jgi:formylglycine-generating enzyme required for sulfatase activity
VQELYHQLKKAGYQPFEPEMIFIPAGEFFMGSDSSKDKKAPKEEQPQHRLYLPDYYMAKTPVTNAQYAAFVQATDHQTTAEKEGWSYVWIDQDLKIIEGADWQHPYGPQSNIIKKDDYPAVVISWHDAVAYCHWLAKVTGRPYRLPGEAEWEKAARGSDGRIYPWGNQWDPKRCNTSEGGQGGTTPMGVYSDGASPYGLLDMAGNVWEWCATKWQKTYPYDVEADEWQPDYLDGTHSRVLRGGSWYLNRNYARCSFRNLYLPYDRFNDFGFRVVLASI